MWTYSILVIGYDCVTYDVWVFTYDRNVSFDILGPICWSQEQPGQKPNNALQSSAAGSSADLHYVSRLLGGAHKTWPLGLTFVAMLGELASQR